MTDIQLNTQPSEESVLAALFPKDLLLKEKLAFALWTTDPAGSLATLNEIETSRLANEDLMRRVCFNKQLLFKLYPTLSNVEPVIDVIKHVRPCQLPLVTFSTTTCKRPELFYRTMNGFLRNCKDHNLIHKWLCVDDGSSEEDCELMRGWFPFMEFICKAPEHKGHARSMQLISKKVTTPYLVHVEDDRVCVDPRPYLADAIAILEADDSLGQVVFNHNYAETEHDNILGGELHQTPGGVWYFVHEHATTEAQRRAWDARHGSGPNARYYPHFSLSPSVIRTAVFERVLFEDVLKFEYVFANNFTNAGYRTAFLPGYHFLHTGRLTKDIHDHSKLNAYDLNQTQQFTTHTKYASWVVNLARREDRLRLVRESIRFPFGVFKAIDGKGLDPRHLSSIFTLCRHGDYQMRLGVIGCALSHLALYTQLLKDDAHDGYLIMEDDAAPAEGVVPDSLEFQIQRVMRVQELRGLPSDLILFAIVSKHPRSYYTAAPAIVCKSYAESNEFSMGGTGCYYISKAMAQMALEYVYDNGIDCPIDVILYRLLDHVKGYFVLPPLVDQIGPTVSDVMDNTSFADHYPDHVTVYQQPDFRAALSQVLAL